MKITTQILLEKYLYGFLQIFFYKFFKDSSKDYAAISSEISQLTLLQVFLSHNIHRMSSKTVPEISPGIPVEMSPGNPSAIHLGNPFTIPSSMNPDNLSLIYSAIYPGNYQNLPTRISVETPPGILTKKNSLGIPPEIKPAISSEISPRATPEISQNGLLKKMFQIFLRKFHQKFPRVFIQRFMQDFFSKIFQGIG